MLDLNWNENEFYRQMAAAAARIEHENARLRRSFGAKSE